MLPIFCNIQKSTIEFHILHMYSEIKGGNEPIIMLNILTMSDYFKAIDKNGEEREFALDLKQYVLFVDRELCPRIQEMRKIINPTNDIHNVLMNPKETLYLVDETPFYYYKRKNSGDGVYCIIHPQNRNKNTSFHYLPLIPPNEITSLKMYWEKDVDKVIRDPEHKEFNLEVGNTKVYTKDGRFTEAYCKQLANNNPSNHFIQNH